MNAVPLPITAFTVFLAIGAVGFLFLIISLVFGEIFDHLGGGFDSDMDHGGPGFFSGRVMAVFVTAFGGFGAVATHYGLSPLPAAGIGFASGLVFGGAIYMFARFLYDQQSTSEVRSGDLVGQTARVVISIPAGGIGQVRCRLGEELVDKIARTRDGESISENTSVLVEEVLGETVIVKKR
jgi:membrane protein implicated in regulation of membrane protease activity